MIPIYRPFFDHSEVLALLQTHVRREDFESAVANRVSARYGIAFPYGRVGIFAALKALELQQAEVVMPAYTFIAVPQAVVASGNLPVFADISLSDYNMSLDALKRAITPKTRAVIATHLFGYQTDVEAIRALLGDERTILIEDCAQSLLPATGNGRLQGDIGLYSFGISKQLSTVEGGMVVTNSSALYEKIRTFRDNELNSLSFRTRVKRLIQFAASYVYFQPNVYALLANVRAARYKKEVEDAGDPLPDELPEDYVTAFTDFQARVGLAQLKKWDAVVTKRRAIAQIYDEVLSQVPGIKPAPMFPDATFLYYNLLIKGRDDNKFGQRMLAKGATIDRTYDYALPYMSTFRAYAKGEYPCALQAAQEIVNLPIYPNLDEKRARFIAESVKLCLD